MDSNEKKSLLRKILIFGAITAAASAAALLAYKGIKRHRALLTDSPRSTLPRAKNIYITGDSIAALAAAAYLVKDGGYDGHSIHVYGSPTSVLNEEYGSIGEVYYELMKDIDAADENGMSICDIIDNSLFTPDPTVKILDGSHRVRALDISADRATLKAVNKALKKMAGGDKLNDVSIAQYFDDMREIFETDLYDFIEMTFGIRDEYKASEFIKRAEQLLTTACVTGFYDTLYYEFSTAEILRKYLMENGVDFHENAEITNFDIDNNHVNAIHLLDNDARMTIYLNAEDRVIFTAGNILDNRSEGSFSETAALVESVPPSMPLWAQAASCDDNFGIPELVFENAGDSMEFTIVDSTAFLTNKLCELTSSVPENGISLLLTGSNWRMKLSVEPVLDLENDSEEADFAPTILVKGMYCSSYGNFIDKSMRECTGSELLYELCGHLGIIDEWENILENITIIDTVNHPFKTATMAASPRHTRPELMPCDNCYCIGGFMENEAPAATLEQEIISAKKATYALMGIKEKKGLFF